MNIATEVYKRCLSSSGVANDIWYFVRKILVKLCDPVCTLPVHGRELRLPLSHQLPAILKSSPLYDQLPARISAHIHKNGGHLTCVDVGANVGDTLASFYNDADDIFLAIEPYGKFSKLLRRNWAWNKNVTVISDFCSSESDLGSFEIREINGTASISQVENGTRINKRTLDEIVEDYPHAGDINVIKIDTDGHDLEVIAGAMKLITRNMPVILFECEPLDTEWIGGYLRTLKILQDTGYTSFLLYDSLGNFLGIDSLSDLSRLEQQLLYQMEHEHHDFEILVMGDSDIHRFHASESDYFAGRLSQ